MSATLASASSLPAERTLLGHTRGLVVLFFVEILITACARC